MLPFPFPRPEGRPLRLLCLGAHSDDIEIGCGGTVLTLLGSMPVDCTWVVFGTADPRRRREAIQGADSFLASAASRQVTLLEFRDSWFPAVWGQIKEAMENLKVVQPDIILTHHLDDRHQDHRIIAELTWNTWRDNLIVEYEIPKFDGDLGHPNLFSPLNPAIVDAKIAALFECFTSQHDKQWFDRALFRSVLRLRGVECHSPTGYAEAFHARKQVVSWG